MGVEVHCPTRFATAMFFAKDLMAIETEIQGLVWDTET